MWPLVHVDTLEAMVKYYWYTLLIQTNTFSQSVLPMMNVIAYGTIYTILPVYILIQNKNVNKNESGVVAIYLQRSNQFNSIIG